MSFHLCWSKLTYKPHIPLQNKEVEYKSEVKFLGLCITENLNWWAHIRFLCHSLSNNFLLLNLLKTF